MGFADLLSRDDRWPIILMITTTGTETKGPTTPASSAPASTDKSCRSGLSFSDLPNDAGALTQSWRGPTHLETGTAARREGNPPEPIRRTDDAARAGPTTEMSSRKACDRPENKGYGTRMSLTAHCLVFKRLPPVALKALLDSPNTGLVRCICCVTSRHYNENRGD